MAENTFRSNVRDQRYSTSKALGFRGGSVGADGNLIAPSAGNVAGPAPVASPAATSSAGGVDIPRPSTPSTGATLATGLGVNVGGAFAKEGVKSLFGKSGMTDTVGKTAKTGVDEGKTTLADGGDTDTFKPGVDEGKADYQLTSGEAGGDGVTGWGTDEAAGVVGDEAAGYFGDGFGGYGTDEALGAIGEEAAGGFGDAAGAFGDAVGGSVPIVGPLLRLANGDAKGAAGSAIGGAIGSVFGPIGTAAGSFIGGAIAGGCFITEAVMSAQGMDDNSEELEILRAFRDNIMMQSPEGQAMVAEYEQIAPMIVEAIGQREDGMQIFQQIFTQFITPAVEAIKAGDYKAALEIYAKMVAFAASFSEEVMQGDEEAMAGIGQLGDHAAMMSHDDDATAGIAGQGVGDTDWQTMDMPEDDGGDDVMAQEEPPAIANMGAGVRRF